MVESSVCAGFLLGDDKDDEEAVRCRARIDLDRNPPPPPPLVLAFVYGAKAGSSALLPSIISHARCPLASFGYLAPIAIGGWYNVCNVADADFAISSDPNLTDGPPNEASSCLLR